MRRRLEMRVLQLFENLLARLNFCSDLAPEKLLDAFLLKLGFANFTLLSRVKHYRYSYLFWREAIKSLKML